MKKLRKILTFALAAVLACSPLMSSMTAFAVQTTYNMGKNHPTEVVATVDSTAQTITLSMNYVYDAGDPANYPEELPNPGLMADGAQTALATYCDQMDLEDYTLIIGDGIKSIGENAFTGIDAITSIVNQSDDLKKIGANAFSENDELSYVDFGDAEPDVIKANTFLDCTKLSSIDIPSSVESIESGAFANTGISLISGGDSVTSIADGAFNGSDTIQIDTVSTAIVEYDWMGNGYENIILQDGSVVYTVTFQSGLEGVYVEPVSVIADSIVAEPTAPTDPNNTFVGWFADAACTTAYQFETPVTSNITIYGKWHVNNVTITFDAMNGTTNTSVTTKYGGTVTKPTDPINGDKVFAGWFRDSAYTQSVDLSKATFDKDTTLYAKYVDPTYHKVKFDTKGGSDVEDVSVRSGNKLSRPTDPELDDYTFDGWYKDDSYEEEWDFDEMTVTKDRTLVAKWKSNFVTVKFDTNGAGTIQPVVVERGKTLTAPADPAKENCEFIGWYTDEGCTSSYTFGAKVNNDLTLYAGWNQTAFTVKFEPNGGVSTIDSVVANPGTLIAKPVDPVKEGYHLVAWCSDSGLSKAWDFNANQVNGDMTLYAKWAVGTTPAVKNTGAAVPQTGDATSAIPTVGSLLSTVGCAVIGKRKKWF